ncbi:uncharacterized protein VICG_01441 [Vittaforma corneae ATCC 50505]|uniref:Mediator complex subunit 15 KIX domain-containing protein n=1 Tax=Vittaforma corneae (strain ATCC 50505) TaxID=993615 RepID=L2GMP5_VITCO|nr:uncharacterized protein VICG_01441 [Vittaforma corneae ATCC 50505]ELA41577.1 hypothetical protein VICG_01441 [Vittaforma corneae ATCC 50505]
MDISRDLRRKMIMKLIEALKESPSFCNISDSHLNEAVLNSEHHTFQHSKSKDEYIAYINEKIRKIKQSTVSRAEPLDEERASDNMTVRQKNYYEDDRSKIINGNIPPYVKVSQMYSQEPLHQPNSNSRKLDSFSVGFDRQNRMYTSEKTLPQSNMAYTSPDIPSEHFSRDSSYPFVDQHYYASQGNAQVYGYSPNFYDQSACGGNYTPQPQRNVSQNSSAAYSGYYCSASVNTKETASGCVIGGTDLYARPSFGEESVPQSGVRAAKPKDAKYSHVSCDQSKPTSRFLDKNTTVHFSNRGDPNVLSQSTSQNNASQILYNADQRPFQNSVNVNNSLSGAEQFGGNPPLNVSISLNGNQGSVNTGHQKMACMFVSSDGKFKTDLYSDKFNVPRADLHFGKFSGPFVKRSSPATSLSDLENDPRLVRNPSYRSDSGHDVSSYVANVTNSGKSADKFKKYTQSRITDTNTGTIRELNTAFEYSYGTQNCTSNRSFVGNINPELLNQSGKTNVENELYQMKSYQRISQPDNGEQSRLFSTASKPFDDKKSEELFKSISEEFMKTSTNLPGSQKFVQAPQVEDHVLETPKQSQQSVKCTVESNACLFSPIETIQASDAESNLSLESSDEYDDQIPEKLQMFLDENQLILKEIGSDEEWRSLFDQAYQGLKMIGHALDLPFKAKLEIQNEFIEFPFCDESDLKEFLEFMEGKKSTSDHLKANKDDYLGYIDKAIEAFSEKQRQSPNVCWDDLGNTKDNFSE